jgi:hypothetical protein
MTTSSSWHQSQVIPDTNQVELTKAVWPSVSTVVHSATIALESGASPMANGLFQANDLAAAAIDKPVLLPF